MEKWKKILEKCSRGDRNIRWNDIMVLFRHFEIYEVNPKKGGSHRVFSHRLMEKYEPDYILMVPRPHGKREKYIHFKKAKEIADYIEMIQYYKELEG